MKLKSLFCIGMAAISMCSCNNGGDQKMTHIPNQLRAPMYPLVTIDPYTSAWSASDKLFDSPVKHWTGKNFPLLGVAKVDGVSYRFMGDVLGAEEEAEKLAAYAEETFEDIAEMNVPNKKIGLEGIQ
jgi:hypothetical protein